LSELAAVGRTALVTGAGRGIGRGIALALADAGASVAVNYRRDGHAAAEVIDVITAGGGRAVAVQASIDDPSDVERLAAEATAALGTIDILVANAGVASLGLPVADTERSELERVMATHSFSTHQLVRLLLPEMRQQPRSDVIVISSSELDAMRAGGAPYNMAKAALEAFALTLAHEEVDNGVHVNIVAPGLTVSEMGDRLVRAKLGLDGVAQLDAQQPLGRAVRPADIASAVLFLVSGAAELITGQRIVVDGGNDASPTG
jgi:NAD(P)-dependent dehydrogenase (short-subunit alcohol dehydrogenase family)